MRIMAVQGSPRSNGNTDILLKQYLKGVVDNHSDIEITEVFIQEKVIEECKGCNACQTGKIQHCILKDDMEDFYKKYGESDIVILATPIYVFSMSSQLKKFMDRLHAAKSEDLMGKKYVLLTTYGDIDAISSGAINVENIIKQLAIYTDSILIQNYGVSTGMNVDFVSQDQKTLEEVYNLGKKMSIY